MDTIVTSSSPACTVYNKYYCVAVHAGADQIAAPVLLLLLLLLLLLAASAAELCPRPVSTACGWRSPVCHGMSATRSIEAVAVPWPGQLAPSKLLAYAVSSLLYPPTRVEVAGS